MEVNQVNVVPIIQQQSVQFEDKLKQVIKSPDISHLNVGDDEPAIKQLQHHDAQALLNERILASLSETLEIEGAKRIDQLVPEDYAPDKVADRILGFIRASMTLFAQRGGDGDHILQKFDQALIGIERGFSEARDILHGLGVLHGEVEEGIDETYALITRGMEKLYGELTGA